MNDSTSDLNPSSLKQYRAHGWNHGDLEGRTLYVTAECIEDAQDAAEARLDRVVSVAGPLQ